MSGDPGDPRDPVDAKSPRGRNEFPTTQWSVLADLEAATPDARRAALDALATAYWKPIYAFICARTGSQQEARDLTQDFFVWVMETGFLSRADRERGRFRALVKVALKNYLGMEGRKERTLKRGGNVVFVGLDEPACAALAEKAMTGDPEKVLDALWSTELIQRATALLKTAYESEGKTTYFQVFQDYYLDESAELNYKAAAEKHGISVTDVDNYLRNAKRRFVSTLRALVAETVGGAGDLEQEMRELFGGIGS